MDEIYSRKLEKFDKIEESDKIIDLEKEYYVKKSKKVDDLEHLYKALMMGMKNYIIKNNFKSVTLGLSGGIDSALTLTILADIIKTENIKSFFLPSKYSSQESKKDAFELSRNLGVNTNEISIEILRKEVLKELKPIFNKLEEDTTEENVQSRIRGLLLMAISNKYNSLLITTGNKSELAVGYATLYGDMCGGYSLLKDVYKTTVIELCNWRNENILEEFYIKKLNIIPNQIITKEPSAELKFNQTDRDSLPPYKVLDQILEMLIDQNKDIESIVKSGFNKRIINRVWKMIKNSEFKRYQSAVGPKISKLSLSVDRRFPLTNKFELQ